MQSLRRLLGFMDTGAESEHAQGESYNPWSIVNLVFRHLADEGLHPVLGESGDPGKPAAELLRALGITPAFESRPHVLTGVSDELARLRQAFEADSALPGDPRTPRTPPDPPDPPGRMTRVSG
jgi:hypothetical protein